MREANPVLTVLRGLPYNRLRRAIIFSPRRAAKYLQEVPLWQSNPSASA